VCEIVLHLTFSAHTMHSVPPIPGDAAGPRGYPALHAGDVVVTAVGRQYMVGRVRPDGRTQDLLTTGRDVSEAIATAHRFVGPDHRVFLFPNPGKNEYRMIPKERELLPATPPREPDQKDTTQSRKPDQK
jgi:hypothetical protein